LASDPNTVSFLLDQLSAAGAKVTAKKMFGEYGLYLADKMVAMVCDDRLFVKRTIAGAAFTGPTEEAPPYPGAKPQPLIDADRWDDGDWLAELFRLTAAELPAPKPKKLRSPKA
jgi:TfoX/Sxy family transcriptional regulator of competence genes